MGTRTYAVMEVSAAVYDEIRAKLEAAEYQHAIGERGELDMHGIALRWDGRGRLGVATVTTPDIEGAYRRGLDEVVERFPEGALEAVRGMGERVQTAEGNPGWRDPLPAGRGHLGPGDFDVSDEVASEEEHQLLTDLAEGGHLTAPDGDCPAGVVTTTGRVKVGGTD